MGKKKRARNNIHHGAPDASVLAGLTVPRGSTDTKTITYPPESLCPGGCGYRRTWCGCPGSTARLDGARP